jgi:hypothetical protein
MSDAPLIIYLQWYRPEPSDVTWCADQISDDDVKYVRADEIERPRSVHCKDCCCARSWEALGITEYTGRSIPEEIERLQGVLDAALKRCRKTLDDTRGYPIWSMCGGAEKRLGRSSALWTVW